MADNFGRGLGSLIPGSPQKIEPAAVKPEADKPNTLRAFCVAPDLIDPNPFQPRTMFNEEKIIELTDSIREHGIMEPLVAIEKEGGRYELIAGERRLKAAKKLGLETVPIVVRKADDLERLELSLVENIQRQELNPIDEAEGYRELVETFGLNQDEVAKKIGKSRQVVSNTLRLLELPNEMQKAVARGEITPAHARVILSVDNPRDQQEIFKEILSGKLSVKDSQDIAAPKSKRSKSAKDPALLADEIRLREALSTKVQIEKRGSRGRIVIHFYSDDDYGEMLGKICQEN